MTRRRHCDLDSIRKSLLAGDTQRLFSSYAYYKQVFEMHPNTSSLWTPDAIALAEFGIQIIFYLIAATALNRDRGLKGSH